MDEAARPDRIAALDLIRGVAVLGILAVNIAGFAAVDSASYSPHLPLSGGTGDKGSFLVTLVLFEGKMRALFTLLFGASLLLFVERAEDSGRDGAGLQLRRLGWLALIGYLHFALLWDGDILFLYAGVGFLALAFRRAVLPAMLAGLLLFAGWQGLGWAMWGTPVRNEAAVAAATASASQRTAHAVSIAAYRVEDRKEAAMARLGFADATHARLAERWWYPLLMLVFVTGETLPLMLVGMALLQSGFFAGGWTRRQLGLTALVGIGAGGAMTLAFANWASASGFPEQAMQLWFGYLLGFPHLLMALGYAALLVLAAPRLSATRIGQRMIAAGRMAFSNYLGTSLVMTALFSGWGFGWFGRFGAAELWLFVALGWALMLGWSAPWLARFRQGPLEWLWRSLTEWRMLPIKR